MTTYLAELDWLVMGARLVLIADLLAEPSATTAMALTVSVEDTVMAPVYFFDEVVGDVPLMV